jgi:GNAT superfamily N-acetyltransferase
MVDVPMRHGGGRLATLARLLGRREWEALRANLERNTFPKPAFYVRRLVFCRLTEVYRVSRPLDFITVREAGPADEARLRAVRDHSQGYRHMFERGDLCFLAEAGGEPAAFLWVEPGPSHDSGPNAYTFEMGERGCWSYGVEVHPAYRLKGAFAKLWTDAFDLIRARGFETIYTSMPEDENVASLRSHGRLGFEIFCRYRVVRFLGLSRYAVSWSDEGRESGWGTWRGRDPRTA